MILNLTKYNNEIFYHFQIKFPSDYENDGPLEIFCMTDIYHPNIDTSDMFSSSSPNVCLNLLESGKWSRKFGLESVVLGLVFIFHNPNLSDPLYDEIATDKETLEKNAKRYMNGDDVDGRTFAADFLKEMEATNIKEENMTKIVEKSKTVDDNTNAEIQSDECVSDSIEGIAVNLPSDSKGMKKMLDELK